MNKIFLMLLVCIILSAGCSTLDSFVSPSAQCSLIKMGVRTGLKITLGKMKASNEYKVKLQAIIKDQILPKLKNEIRPVTRQDLDNVLFLLDKNLSEEHKPIIQNAIELLLAWTPKFPDIKNESIGSSILKNVICLFQGVFESLIDQGASLMKTKKNISLQWK